MTVTLAFETAGPGTGAPTLVLLGSLGADRSMWDPQFRARVSDYLRGSASSRADGVRICAEAPLRWVAPGLLRHGDPSPPRGRLLLWTDQLIRFPKVTVSQAGQVIASRRLPWPASPGRVFRVPSSILDSVDPGRGAVSIMVHTHPAPARRQDDVVRSREATL